MAQQKLPRQSPLTSPWSTWIHAGSCPVFDLRMYKMTVTTKNGTQQIRANITWIPTLKILNLRRIPARQKKRLNAEQTNTAAMATVKTRPTIILFQIIVVTFSRAPFNGSISSSLTGRSVWTSSDITFERLRGKVSHIILWANPTQNCFVPIEQFFGINVSTASGIAVATEPAALSIWLTTSGTAVAMPSAALATLLWKISNMPRSRREFLSGMSWSIGSMSAKSNYGRVITRLTEWKSGDTHTKSCNSCFHIAILAYSQQHQNHARDEQKHNEGWCTSL